MNLAPLTLAAGALFSAVAAADIVHVKITGVVEFNQVTFGPLAGAHAGDPAVLEFDVDSNNYVNSPTWPTRGYVIIQSSWSFHAGTGTVPLASPMPANTTPYFMLRNNDPAVDGFVVSAGVDTVAPLPVAVGINNASTHFLRTFTNGTVLPSLDILDALGHWEYEFLSVYGWSVGIGENDFFSVEYQSITIARGGACYANCDDSTSTPALNVADFTCFLQKYAAGDSYANCDSSTSQPALNVADFTCFLQKYAAGCP